MQKPCTKTSTSEREREREREREDLKERHFKRGLGEVRENSVENILLVMFDHLQDTLHL
jgi:hypothetical protein